MKHNNSFYLQLTREIFTEKYQGLSLNAKWLFVVLNELEQRYSGVNDSCFHRMDVDLSVDSGLSLSSIKRAKKELKESGLVQITQGHFADNKTGKLSKKHITCYRILK